MVREDKSTWKANYFVRLLSYFDQYPKCFIVGVDNVGSKQMQQIRISLRGHAEVLMGKNTMIRKAIRGNVQKNPALEKLLPHIVGNVGFVFTNSDLSDIREQLLSNKVAAPAKAGALAPCDVYLDPQNTGMGPEKTSFFQALSIPTKIARGTIEILNRIQLIVAGDKVGASEATLLNMLGVSPFTYGLEIQQVYDNGSVYSPGILDIKTEDIHAHFLQGVANIASLSLAINYPTMASVPHSLANGFRNLMAIAAATDVTFKEAETMKEILADPSKLAALAAQASAVVAPTAGAGGAAPKEAKEEKKEEPEEEEDEDMGFGLFD